MVTVSAGGDGTKTPGALFDWRREGETTGVGTAASPGSAGVEGPSRVGAPVPVTGVHDGGSLHGNDSSDASSTTSERLVPATWGVSQVLGVGISHSTPPLS